MTLRRALYMSRNIIAVKLGMEIGEDAVISEATKFGLTTRIPPYPSIHIGSADVIPLGDDLGLYHLLQPGNPDAAECDPPRRGPHRQDRLAAGGRARSPVMDTAHAWLITDALRDVVRHGTAVGSVGSRINFPAGGKTGTTNDGFDVWFIGFTPDLVTGVWIGFDQPKKIKANAQGGILAAPAWTAMMREVYERRAIPGAWPRPDGLTALDIDKTTGYKATPFCPKDVHYIESFIPGTEPADFCPIHSPFGAVGTGAMGTGPAPPTAPGSCPIRPRCKPAGNGERGQGRRRCRVHGAARGPPRRNRGRVPARRLSARWLMPIDGPPVERGALLIGADGRIVAAGTTERVPSPPGVESESFDDAILVPGLVNTHTHLELTGLAADSPEADFAGWIRRLRQRKAERTPEEFAVAARRGLVDCWAAGVTTVADTGDSGSVIRALADGGGSGIAYHEVFGPHPSQCKESLAGLQRQVEWLGRFAGKRQRIGVSPHAPYTVSGALYRATASWARSQHLPIAVHLAESHAETELLARGEGMFAEAWRGRGIPMPSPLGSTPVEWLDRHGVLGEHTLCIHLVQVTTGDIGLLAGTGAAVAHCPLSNRSHAHGTAPLARFLSAGLRVGLGTDSVVSVGTLDLLAEAREAAAVAGLNAEGALALCTIEGARALGLQDEVGSLAPGKWGDCAVIRPPESSGTLPPPARVLASGPRDVVATYVGGKDVHRLERPV